WVVIGDYLLCGDMGQRPGFPGGQIIKNNPLYSQKDIRLKVFGTVPSHVLNRVPTNDNLMGKALTWHEPAPPPWVVMVNDDLSIEIPGWPAAPPPIDTFQLGLSRAKPKPKQQKYLQSPGEHSRAPVKNPYEPTFRRPRLVDLESSQFYVLYNLKYIARGEQAHPVLSALQVFTIISHPCMYSLQTLNGLLSHDPKTGFNPKAKAGTKSSTTDSTIGFTSMALTPRGPTPTPRDTTPNPGTEREDTAELEKQHRLTNVLFPSPPPDSAAQDRHTNMLSPTPPPATRTWGHTASEEPAAKRAKGEGHGDIDRKIIARLANAYIDASHALRGMEAAYTVQNAGLLSIRKTVQTLLPIAEMAVKHGAMNQAELDETRVQYSLLKESVTKAVELRDNALLLLTPHEQARLTESGGEEAMKHLLNSRTCFQHTRDININEWADAAIDGPAQKLAEWLQEVQGGK
ncbi:MAG: hypothetical protein Q9224_004526, partial [Gallowayella concinna]